MLSQVNGLAKIAKNDLVAKRKSFGWYPFNNTRGSTGGQNVLTGAVKADGTIMDAHSHPCHAYIHGYKDAEILWSAFGWRSMSKPIAKDYLKWLLKDSPWAKNGMADEVSSFDFTFDEGFLFRKILVNRPANLLHNFLVASRMAAEWPKHIVAWHMLINKYKVDPAFAFLFLTCFSPTVGGSHFSATCFDSDQLSTIAYSDFYDWPLDMGRATEQYALNFCRGKVADPSKNTFFPTAVTAPVNTVWGKLVSPQSAERYVRKLFDLYGKEFGTPRPGSSTGSDEIFAKHMDTTQRVFSSDALLKIIKKEEKRLKI